MKWTDPRPAWAASMPVVHGVAVIVWTRMAWSRSWLGSARCATSDHARRARYLRRLGPGAPPGADAW